MSKTRVESPNFSLQRLGNVTGGAAAASALALLLLTPSAFASTLHDDVQSASGSTQLDGYALGSAPVKSVAVLSSAGDPCVVDGTESSSNSDCTSDDGTSGDPGWKTPSMADSCAPEEFASLEDYITGQVDPPACFPYQPTIKETSAGTRALDPYTDGCSGPTRDKVPGIYDFRDACGMHDYAYDLLRYGVSSFREPDADGQLLSDLDQECDSRPLTARACRKYALAWRAGVRFGNVEPGDGITDH